MLTTGDLAAFREIAEALADSTRQFEDYAVPRKPKNREERASWKYQLSGESRRRLVNDLVLKMVGGHGYGLDPLDAVSNYWITPQFHQPHARYFLARMKSHPNYDCNVIKSDAEKCVLEIHRLNKVKGEWERAEFTLTREDADVRNISTLGNGVKRQWRQEPQKMLQWAAVREAMRVFCPDLLGDEPLSPDDGVAPPVNEVASTGDVPVSAEPSVEKPAPSDAKAPTDYDRLMAFLETGEACDYDTTWKGVTTEAMLRNAFGVIAARWGVEAPSAPEMAEVWRSGHKDRGVALLAFDASQQTS